LLRINSGGYHAGLLHTISNAIDQGYKMLFFMEVELILISGFREKARNPEKNAKSENELGHN